LFSGQNLPTNKDRRRIKVSEHADFRLVYLKRKNKQIDTWIVFSGPEDVIKIPRSLPVVASHQKKFKLKGASFF